MGRKPESTVYYVVFFTPFGRRLPSAFPEVVHECRDPRASIAIGKLPTLMRRHGYGRYAVLEVPAVGRRRYVVTVTFSDAEADQIERSPHSCPQCQAVRRITRAKDRQPCGNELLRGWRDAESCIEYVKHETEDWQRGWLLWQNEHGGVRISRSHH